MGTLHFEGQNTSGVPFGSKNSSGTTLDTLALGFELGGEGLVEYSVSEKVFMLGVCGLDSKGKPLTCAPFSVISAIVQLSIDNMLCVEVYMCCFVTL